LSKSLNSNQVSSYLILDLYDITIGEITEDFFSEKEKYISEGNKITQASFINAMEYVVNIHTISFDTFSKRRAFEEIFNIVDTESIHFILKYLFILIFRKRERRI
jgi:hypothetical protein